MREGTQVVLALGLGVTAVSSAATAILLAAPLPPLWIAAGRVFVTGSVFLVLGGPRLCRRLLARPREPAVRATSGELHHGLLGRIALAGLFLALHFGAWVASLSMTSVLRSTALVALQPVFAGLLGRVLGDRVSPWLYVGAVVSLGGTALMLGLVGGGAPGDLRGDALALLGAGAAAAYLAVGRSVRDAVPLRVYLAVVHLFASVVLVAAAWIVGTRPIAIGSSTPWLAVAYLGLVPGVLGHGAFNWVVRRAPIDRVALAILLEPVGATVLAWLVLGGSVSVNEVVGAGVVLLGVALGSLTPRSATSRGTAGKKN